MGYKGNMTNQLWIFSKIQDPIYHPGLPHSLRGLWLESLGEGPQGLLFLWLMEVIGSSKHDFLAIWSMGHNWVPS